MQNRKRGLSYNKKIDFESPKLGLNCVFLQMSMGTLLVGFISQKVNKIITWNFFLLSWIKLFF